MAKFKRGDLILAGGKKVRTSGISGGLTALTGGGYSLESSGSYGLQILTGPDTLLSIGQTTQDNYGIKFEGISQNAPLIYANLTDSEINATENVNLFSIDVRPAPVAAESEIFDFFFGEINLYLSGGDTGEFSVNGPNFNVGVRDNTTAGLAYGIQSGVFIESGSTIQEVYSTVITTSIAGTANGNVYALYLGPGISSGGSTSSNVYGLYSRPSIHGSSTFDGGVVCGVFSDMSGVADSPGVTGTSYGLYINPSTSSTTNYGFYIAGASAKNEIEGTFNVDGNVAIGPSSAIDSDILLKLMPKDFNSSNPTSGIKIDNVQNTGDSYHIDLYIINQPTWDNAAYNVDINNIWIQNIPKLHSLPIIGLFLHKHN
jgi:hypothetical protein